MTSETDSMLLHKAFLANDGEQIYYETAGNPSGPVMVFAHGLGGNHISWYQQVAYFAPFCRVITWDQRGFGRTTNVTGKAGPQKAAADLAALVRHLDVGPVHVIGQSMGGWGSLGCTLQHPELVRSLVMADTIGGIHTERIAREYGEYSARVAAIPLDAVKPLDEHPALASDLGSRDRARAFLYNQISSISLAAPVESIRRQLPVTFWPAEQLSRMKVPTLFIVGERDGIFSPDMIREAAAKVPGSVVKQIPVAGHSPYFETPDAWNQLVHEFVKAHS